MVSVSESLADIALVAARAPTPKPADARRKFRASIAWRRTRYAVLAANAERNGGIARCALCGAKAEPGAPLHVDHVYAISTPEGWEKRLDKSFLQVLCPDCNVGKLNGPARDFRTASS